MKALIRPGQKFIRLIATPCIAFRIFYYYDHTFFEGSPTPIVFTAWKILQAAENPIFTLDLKLPSSPDLMFLPTHTHVQQKNRFALGCLSQNSPNHRLNPPLHHKMLSALHSLDLIQVPHSTFHRSTPPENQNTNLGEEKITRSADEIFQLIIIYFLSF